MSFTTCFFTYINLLNTSQKTFLNLYKLTLRASLSEEEGSTSNNNVY